MARGPRKKRKLASDHFFVDMFTSALKPDEVLTDIRVLIQTSKSGGAYAKLERKAGDFATVGAATQISLYGESVWK